MQVLAFHGKNADPRLQSSVCNRDIVMHTGASASNDDVHGQIHAAGGIGLPGSFQDDCTIMYVHSLMHIHATFTKYMHSCLRRPATGMPRVHERYPGAVWGSPQLTPALPAETQSYTSGTRVAHAWYLAGTWQVPLELKRCPAPPRRVTARPLYGYPGITGTHLLDRPT